MSLPVGVSLDTKKSSKIPLSKSKLSILFSDVISQEFSPRFQQVLSPGIYQHSGKTPKALTFSRFGFHDLFDSSSPLESVRSTTSLQRFTDSSSDADSPVSTESSTEVCPYFLKGGCRFRKNCRLSHQIGADCPYCQQVLPTTWTQQSKHLRRCWESQVDGEELEQSREIACQICLVDVVRTGRQFGLMSGCVHALCVSCAQQLWNPRKKCIECPICKTVSSCIMPRDRMFFDEERKDKMFGLYLKKEEKQQQQALRTMSNAHRPHNTQRFHPKK